MKTCITSPTGWQVDDRPLWARIRRWVIHIVERELRNGRLADEGPVLPFALLGHRVIVGKGRIELRTPWGMLVVHHDGLKVKQAFLASFQPDMFGIHHVHTWLVGAPPAVTKVVETRAVA